MNRERDRPTPCPGWTTKPTALSLFSSFFPPLDRWSPADLEEVESEEKELRLAYSPGEGTVWKRCLAGNTCAQLLLGEAANSYCVKLLKMCISYGTQPRPINLVATCKQAESHPVL